MKEDRGLQALETEIPITVKNEILGLPKTHPMYYEDPYLNEFEAWVVKVINLEGFRCIILDRTCFFPEGGGQLGDVGYIQFSSGELKVVDTRAEGDVIVHISSENVEEIKEGDAVRGILDWDTRYERMKQHTASHVLFSAIKRVLDLESLMYMGVEIREDTSRIDISHGEAISKDRLREIERISNEVCLKNRKVKTWATTREEAERIYGAQLGITETTPSGTVRVVEVEDWDAALCSGTHVGSTREMGLIHILDRFRLKKGVERIEFTAGKGAYQRYGEAMETLTQVAEMLNASISDVPDRIGRLVQSRENLKKDLRKAREQLAESQILQLLDQAEAIGAFRLVHKKLSDVDARTLKWIASSIVEKNPQAIAILGSVAGSRVFLIGTAGDEAVKRGVDMAEMMREAAQVIEGGGGGSPRLAQAGGNAPSKLDEAFDLITAKISAKLRELDE